MYVRLVRPGRPAPRSAARPCRRCHRRCSPSSKPTAAARARRRCALPTWARGTSRSTASSSASGPLTITIEPECTATSAIDASLLACPDTCCDRAGLVALAIGSVTAPRFRPRSGRCRPRRSSSRAMARPSPSTPTDASRLGVVAQGRSATRRRPHSGERSWSARRCMPAAAATARSSSSPPTASRRCSSTPRNCRSTRSRRGQATRSMSGRRQTERCIASIAGGTPKVVFDPDERYIWALATTRDGTLLVATGEKGRCIASLPPASRVASTAPRPHT